MVILRRTRSTQVTELATWSGRAGSKQGAQAAALAEEESLAWGPVDPPDSTEIGPAEIDNIETLAFEVVDLPLPGEAV